MKKILITGANSYIGVSFENHLKKWCDQYSVDTVDMIDGTWREKDFSCYDTVFHVAGIAHQKETRKNADIYYKVNYELAVETAAKAKNEGVKQFIFLSSMSVYGMDHGVITRETVPIPKSNYGRSKWQAEVEITAMQSATFNVCVLRPPMVYGKDCKGNFQTIIKVVKKFSFFPKVHNQRSMIYIDNLCSFVKLCLDEKLKGVYFPQNKEYVRTVDIAKAVAHRLSKKLLLSRLLGLCVCMGRPCVKVLQKAFGTLIYVDTDDFDFKYCVIGNADSLNVSI